MMWIVWIAVAFCAMIALAHWGDCWKEAKEADAEARIAEAEARKAEANLELAKLNSKNAEITS